MRLIKDTVKLSNKIITSKSLSHNAVLAYTGLRMIIPGLFEPPVRTLRATIPENESHIFR